MTLKGKLLERTRPSESCSSGSTQSKGRALKWAGTHEGGREGRPAGLLPPRMCPTHEAEPVEGCSPSSNSSAAPPHERPTLLEVQSSTYASLCSLDTDPMREREEKTREKGGPDQQSRGRRVRRERDRRQHTSEPKLRGQLDGVTEAKLGLTCVHHQKILYKSGYKASQHGLSAMYSLPADKPSKCCNVVYRVSGRAAVDVASESSWIGRREGNGSTRGWGNTGVSARTRRTWESDGRSSSELGERWLEEGTYLDLEGVCQRDGRLASGRRAWPRLDVQGDGCDRTRIKKRRRYEVGQETQDS